MEFLDEILQLSELATRATVYEVLVSMGASFVFGLLISYTYMRTYKGRHYSQGFAQTLVIVSVVISIVIVAIGSNIARAFSLAGALSIIRFRSAISDPRDVAFIFFAMGAGLAVGAGLVIPGGVFAVVLSGLIFLLSRLNYGGKQQHQKVLKITIPENLNYEGLFDDIFREYLEYYTLLHVKTVSLGTMFELSYSVRPRKYASERDIMDKIRQRNGNLSVASLLDEQTIV